MVTARVPASTHDITLLLNSTTRSAHRPHVEFHHATADASFETCHPPQSPQAAIPRSVTNNASHAEISCLLTRALLNRKAIFDDTPKKWANGLLVMAFLHSLSNYATGLEQKQGAGTAGRHCRARTLA
eukprot:GFKZ01014986.1.p1 GENE.GFKZ01014986.1~~GFKZ01014986.1.p1  ORF type:complete len:128 (+),score=2.10 GFKZ01014986.1:485-868(+)